MKTFSRCHKVCATTPIELLIIAGADGLIADVIWVFRDMFQWGHGWLYLIAGMLISAVILTVYAGFLHHKRSVEVYQKQLLTEKLATQKVKTKARKHKENYHETFNI
jgi:hypothetical protein